MLQAHGCWRAIQRHMYTQLISRRDASTMRVTSGGISVESLSTRSFVAKTSVSKRLKTISIEATSAPGGRRIRFSALIVDVVSRTVVDPELGFPPWPRIQTSYVDPCVISALRVSDSSNRE